MNETAGKRLEMLIDSLGLNDSDFAASIGIPKSSLSMYLNGKRSMRSDRLCMIADKYGVNEAWLMGFDVPMKKVSSSNEDELFKLSPVEKELVTAFRSADNITQNNVLKLLDVSIEKEGASSLNA